MGRSTRLTPAIASLIAEKVSNGVSFGVACQACSISPESGWEWLRRGNGTDKRPSNDAYANFANAIKKAEAQAESKAIAAIVEAGDGYRTIETKTTIKPDGDTIVETKETITKHWQAHAWILERKYPARWGRTRTDLIDALKVLIDLEILPETILDSAANEIENLKQALRRSLGQETNNSNN